MKINSKRCDLKEGNTLYCLPQDCILVVGNSEYISFQRIQQYCWPKGSNFPTWLTLELTSKSRWRWKEATRRLALESGQPDFCHNETTDHHNDDDDGDNGDGCGRDGFLWLTTPLVSISSGMVFHLKPLTLLVNMSHIVVRGHLCLKPCSKVNQN